MNICIFAGTTEGRKLAEKFTPYCHLYVCVATEYGKLLDEVSGAQVHVGRMDEAEMTEFFRKNEIELVVDATHPYAVLVSQNIRSACETAGLEYIRLERKTGEKLGENERIVYVPDAAAAAELLKQSDEKVLLTTGVKELGSFYEIARDRLYVRIIPSVESLTRCLSQVEPGHIIAALGPFSEETNIANLHSTGAKVLVTKQSGKNGGFFEKISAAQKAGARCIIIGTPDTDNGSTYTEQETEELLFQRLGIECKAQKERRQQERKTQVVILGCGSGEEAGLTVEAREMLLRANRLIGSKRLILQAKQMNPYAETYTAIETEKIVEIIKASANEKEKAADDEPLTAVLMSGDSGFFSGTKKLYEALKASGETEVQILPGISSISMLSARTGISWEDAYICSMHGRELFIEEVVKKQEKVFVLLDNVNTVAAVAKRLVAAGLADAYLYAGSMLGTKEEKLAEGYANELEELETMPLSVMFIVRNYGAE